MGITEPLLSLMNRYQRDFPRVASPFLRIAHQLGLTEQGVLGAYQAAQAEGQVSRVGAVLTPRAVGWSTLAAMRVPTDKLDDVAEMVSAVETGRRKAMTMSNMARLRYGAF